jgi:hypothetical protein
MDGPTGYVVLATAAFIAGVMNSLAGGGTLLTFPALMTVLTPLYGSTAAAVANATSTVALLPGSIAGTWGYRREYAAARNFALKMLLPSLLGGWTGSRLLVLYPGHFTPLVPWLILTAAVLFLIQQPLSQVLKRKQAEHLPVATGGKLAVLIGFQFLVATYGGYFGAGIGILMLTALGFMGVTSIHHANGVKTLLASVINGVAVVEFVAGGLVKWKYAGVMAIAAIVGGYVGARVARRLPATYMRWVVVLIGFGLAGYYAWKQWNTTAG